MVTTENYEEYLMQDADGELDGAGKQALQAFMEANPALQAEADAWQSLKLQPEPSLIFPGKESLLKRERKGMVLNLKPYRLAAAAAVMAAFVLMPALWRSDNEYVRIIHTFPAKSTVAPVMIEQGKRATDPIIAKAPVVPAQKDQNRKSEHIVPSEAANRGRLEGKASESIATLDLHSQELLPVDRVAHSPQPVYQEMAMSVERESSQPQPAGLPRIQLAQENRQAFELLKKAIEARVAQASSVARSVKETAFVIKLGNGAVNINF